MVKVRISYVKYLVKPYPSAWFSAACSAIAHCHWNYFFWLTQHSSTAVSKGSSITKLTNANKTRDSIISRNCLFWFVYKANTGQSVPSLLDAYVCLLSAWLGKIICRNLFWKFFRRSLLRMQWGLVFAIVICWLRLWVGFFTYFITHFNGCSLI